MSIWILIWIFVSVCLLSFLLWTLFVLFRQKSAWKAFADKHGLRYEAKGLSQTPEMSGEIGGRKISFFASEHFTEDVRGSRKLTAIEINLASIMPFEGAVANTGMIPLVKTLEFKAEFTPEHEKWNRTFIATGSSLNALKMYLTPARLDMLVKVLRVKNAAAILIFRNDAMLLRLDTPDPIDDLAYLEKLIALLMKAADALELTKGESGVLKAEAAKADARDTVLDAGGSSGEGLSLELEDDGEAEAEEEAEGAVAPKKKSTAKKPAAKKASGKIQSPSKPDTKKS